MEKDSQENGPGFQDIQGDVYEMLLSENRHRGQEPASSHPAHIIKTECRNWCSRNWATAWPTGLPDRVSFCWGPSSTRETSWRKKAGAKAWPLMRTGFIRTLVAASILMKAVNLSCKKAYTATTSTPHGGTACVIVPQGVLFGLRQAFKICRQPWWTCDSKRHHPAMAVFNLCGVSTAFCCFNQVWGAQDNGPKPRPNTSGFYEMGLDGYSWTTSAAKQGGYGDLQNYRQVRAAMLATDTDAPQSCFMVPRSEIEGGEF
ncbi:hypothetical protein FQR65_LT20710 [Abscondita terminalis]|nr:hypothetical protein FQR65_LT20710 [Abscondita terminalis]